MRYGEQVITASKGWCAKTCFVCGQYFKEGEQIVLLIPSFEYKKIYKSLSRNVVAHFHEIEAIKSKCNTEDEFLLALGKHKTPRALPLTAEQLKMIDEFKQACRNYGFWPYVETKDGLKCKLSNSSDVLEYNVRTDRIAYSNKRRKRGLFDGLVENQLVSNVWNKMHEIRGDGLRDNYSAKEVINKAVETVNNMMGR